MGLASACCYWLRPLPAHSRQALGLRDLGFTVGKLRLAPTHSKQETDEVGHISLIYHYDVWKTQVIIL